VIDEFLTVSLYQPNESISRNVYTVVMMLAQRMQPLGAILRFTNTRNNNKITTT